MRQLTKYAIAMTAALGVVMTLLDNTIVNVAFAPIATALKADLSTIQWVVTGYFVAQAAAIPVSGYFSNRFGIKKLFILCLACFTAGSWLCGLAWDDRSLIAFRVIQGLGGGALFPLSQALAFGAFEETERASASAIVGIPILLAPALGPTLGGWLTDKFGWASIFLVNVPVGILAIVLSLLIIPADRRLEAGQRKGFDMLGFVLSTLGVVAVVYAFSLVSQTRPGTQTLLNPQGDIYGWGDGFVWITLIIGLAALIAYGIYALRHSGDPVLDLRQFRRYDFMVGSIVTWMITVIIYGTMLMLPIFLQQVRLPHLSATDAGLVLMSQGIASAIGVGLSGAVARRIGVRAMVIGGAALLALSSWQLGGLTPTIEPAALVPWLIVRGLGFGLCFIPVQTKSLEAIGGAALPKATSLFNTTRQMATSLGVAALVTLYVQQTTHYGNALQAQALRALPSNTPINLHSPAVGHLVAQAATSGMNDVFHAVAIAAVALMVAALALPGRTGSARELVVQPQAVPAK